jgi:hypothetical protein
VGTASVSTPPVARPPLNNSASATFARRWRPWLGGAASGGAARAAISLHPHSRVVVRVRAGARAVPLARRPPARDLNRPGYDNATAAGPSSLSCCDLVGSRTLTGCRSRCTLGGTTAAYSSPAASKRQYAENMEMARRSGLLALAVFAGFASAQSPSAQPGAYSHLGARRRGTDGVREALKSVHLCDYSAPRGPVAAERVWRSSTGSATWTRVSSAGYAAIARDCAHGRRS